ncbi:MAG: hypothetical protein HC854_11990 [Flavobacterium sp.]|nr:hypothetical protein [Flavobacterium sp.]
MLPKSIQEIQNWWYIAEETGQHIAFYANETMDYIAQKFNKNYYSDGRSLHLFTAKKLSQTQIDYSFNYDRKYKKKYFWNKLFQPDFKRIENLY